MNRIGRAGILTMIPHAGAMCLLDEVESWDAANIICRSSRYGDADNPLRRADGTLGASCGIEIAAQAMAVHGRLTACGDGPPRPGFLVSLRDVRLHAARLDAQAGPLIIMARQLLGDARGAAYEFNVSRAAAELVSGRATVLFEAPQ
jgi:predicted hotdog family 3-hydroxylacyl-ACP dehydratase